VVTHVLLVVAVALLGLAAAGCQGSQAPAPAAVAEPAGSLAARLKAEGDRLMLQQAYNEAAAKYQAALNEAPADIPIRYALGVAFSHLGRRAETIEQFQTVVRQGVPDSPEVRAAREWLANAEAPGRSEASARDSATDPTPAKTGKVLGKLRWQDISPHSKLVRVSIRLTGDDVETRNVDVGRDFMLGRVYEFRDLHPGAYRLVAGVGSTTMWDLKVQVPADKETTLDLTEGNSSAAPDFDPPAAD
jgi:tetratricopeptide (TPR) repeat protein